MARRSQPLTTRAGSDVTCIALLGDAYRLGATRTGSFVDVAVQNEPSQTPGLITENRSAAAVSSYCANKLAGAKQLASCPFCRSVCLGRSDDGPQNCARCGRPVLLVQTEPESDRRLAVPAVYGHHHATRLAGRGGMGLVMYGIEETTRKPVAIKLLIGCDRPQPRAIARFHREVAALRNLNHPNVVRLLGHGTVGNQRFLVMDWVQGPTFRDLIAAFRRRRELPPYQIIRRWLSHACAGLAAIHDAGVVHRDIKPSNLIVENGANVRIADFGIATLSPGRSPALDTRDGHPYLDSQTAAVRSPFGLPLTAAGEFSGTADYMAPECLRTSFAASAQSDLYSLGVTFYEISTGERPLHSWPPPSAFNGSLSESFDGVIMKLLAKSPGDRFSSADEAAAALGGSE